MRKQTKVLLITSALVTNLAAAPELLAHDSRDHGMINRGGMMGNGSMMGMRSMTRIMEHCSQMMGGDSRQPNDQWRKAPPPSEKRRLGDK
jgi:hypothetical protein